MATPSLGVGSGLDLSSLVSQLLTAERTPILNSINRRGARLASDLSGVGLMKGALASFQSSLSGLTNVESFSTRKIGNNNTDAISVSAGENAQIGTYNFEVDTLASAQSLASAAYADVTDTVGTGNIQIKFGTITGPSFTSFAVNADKAIQNITVDASNNTLTGLKDTINDGDYGVSATIVNDGSGYRLALTSDDTGVTNALEISITDTGDANDTDASGLSALAYNASATNLTETQAATDASLSINGLAITSQTNKVSEAIEGVTINLLETTTSSFTLSITESSSDLKESIQKMVSAYNEMIGTLNDLSSAGSELVPAGLLVGDASLRNFTNGLSRSLVSPVDGLNGNISALSHIGITTNGDGTLSIDNADFNSAIDENPTDAAALFALVGQTSDSLISFSDSSDSSVPGSYAINITAIATQAAVNGATGVNNLTIDDDNDNLTVLVDGMSTGPLSLTQGVYASAEELATEIQSQINSSSNLADSDSSVEVTYDSGNDRFVITSSVYGSESSVEITSVDTNSTSDLGFSVAAVTTGVDVAGTIGGVTATGSGQSLRVPSGISVDVLGGNTGDRGDVDFSRGFIEGLNNLLDTYLDSDSGNLVVREDSLNESLKGIADEEEALTLRLQAVESRLVRQFTALDQLLAKFQTTGSFISQQLNNLPGSGQLLGK